MTPDDEFAVVYISQGPLGAEVARSKLEAEGLPVLLRYESLGRALGLTVDGLGRVKVCVRHEDATAARAILEAAADDPIDAAVVPEDEC